MKKLCVIWAVSICILCAVGFSRDSAWRYKVLKCERTDPQSIQNAINRHAQDGWEFHSTMIMPADGNYTTTRCSLVFRRKD